MKKVYIGIAIALLMGMNGVAQTRDKAVYLLKRKKIPLKSNIRYLPKAIQNKNQL